MIYHRPPSSSAAHYLISLAPATTNTQIRYSRAQPVRSLCHITSIGDLTGAVVLRDIISTAMSDFMLSADFISQALLNANEDELCHQLHPGTCNAKAINQFANGCKSMYKMYLLVHLIPLLTVKRKKLVKNPVVELRKLVVGFIKSLLFAGGYSMLVRRIICLWTNNFSYKYISAYIAGLGAGVTLLFEPIGRQSQIALYTLNKSMEVVYNMALRRNWPVRIPKGECVLNAIAIAMLSLVYINRPEYFKDNYRKAIDLLLKDC